MRKITYITICGNMFLFDNELNRTYEEKIQAIANSEIFKISSLALKEECTYIVNKFVQVVEDKLNIRLEPIEITSVIRIGG